MTPAPDFAAEHGPGTKWLTASRAPALILPPDKRPAWMPSAYALAAHMLNLQSLPDAGDNPVVKRGKRLEPIALDILAEEGIVGTQARQVRLEHDSLSMLAYPDAVSFFPERQDMGVVEVKVVEARDYDESWGGKAPLAPRVQLHCQLACSDFAFGAIVPLVIGFKKLELGEIVFEERWPDMTALIEERAALFLRLVELGKLPDPDDSASSYETLQKLVDLDPEKEIHLEGEAPRAWLTAWRDASARRLDAEKQEDAARRYFASRAGDATTITVDGDDRPLTRKLVRRKAYEVAASQHWKWTT